MNCYVTCMNRNGVRTRVLEFFILLYMHPSVAMFVNLGQPWESLGTGRMSHQMNHPSFAVNLVVFFIYETRLKFNESDPPPASSKYRRELYGGSGRRLRNRSALLFQGQTRKFGVWEKSRLIFMPNDFRAVTPLNCRYKGYSF